VQKHPLRGTTILRMAEKVKTSLNPVTLEMEGIHHGEELYDFLKEKIYHKAFLYEHTWEKGDVVICDNFTYLHGRRPLGQNKTRSFKRIQIL
jgi:alpha-ketoglutarate-dependent taurine dioxygenase